MRVATCEQPCERKKLTAFIRVYSADRCVFDEKKAKKKKQHLLLQAKRSVT